MSDYETPSVYTETHPTAAKSHRCCECYDEIPKGAVYQHVKGLWDGRWGSFKTCERCESQIEDYRLQVGEQPPFGLLRDWCFNSDIKFWADEPRTV